MVGETRWPAPAKLNLFLHIVGRRDDGYHLLQTVFQFLDYGDELLFTVRDDGVIRRTSTVAGVNEADDLVVRAARLLQSTSGTGLGADIRLDKQLPMGGGLGGGSSDAATALVALNHLWQTGLSIDELAGLGLQLGADVPVFVRGHAAWAEGVGEQLTPVSLPEPWFLVIAPNVHVATGAIFCDPELTRDSRPITIRDFLSGSGVNVFEPLVRQRYPGVDEAWRWLDQFAPARLTGSGGCVFAAFDSEQQAREALGQMPAAWRGFVARGCNHSPLQRCLLQQSSPNGAE